MFLKTLTLKGFKSFADATTLEFEPGITVVVGPNGSGKSNVVDAIGWVLGAQAPSAVRSQKMDDVIFAGTARRSALGRAEVALTIDNSGGLLPIAFTEVTLTRTLFRNGDSEYSINGTPCRLLDISELLSDSGVGRQQHTIISQGQIDAVLNARPEERRLIVEEAAGVLKFRRRKEKAERKLVATEVNFTRLQDLLREIRRSLRPLERQADAARRHGALVTELLALRRHLAGREVAVLRSRLEAGARRRSDLGAEEAALKGSLGQLDVAVLAAEAELSAHGGDGATVDLGEAVVVAEGLRARARGLAAVLAERRRSLEHERGAQLDGAVVASLEADAARLAEELEAVEVDAAALVPADRALATAEADLVADQVAFRAEWAATGAEGGAGETSGRAAARRGALAATQATVDRATEERDRVTVRVDALAARRDRLAADAEALAVERVTAVGAEPELLAAHALAVAGLVIAVDEQDAAETAARAADADRHSWRARADALADALDAARAAAGAEHLAAVDGVIGTLLDLVEVDRGWEAAFEAAAGEALTAVVTDTVEAGRRALASLVAGELPGAVLALGAAASTAPGAVLPPGDALRVHVRGHQGGVDALLDALLAGVVVVDGDWATAVDTALAHPGAVVVTRAGDRFGPSAWRVGQRGTGATGAALDEARERADVAAGIATAAGARLGAARQASTEARRAEGESAAALDDARRRTATAADGLVWAEADRAQLDTELEAMAAELAALAERARTDADRVAALAAELPGLEADEAAAAERHRALAAARRALEERAAAVGARRRDLEVRGAQIEQRRLIATRRREETEARLARHAEAREAAAARRVGLEAKLVAVDRLTALVTDRLGRIERELAAVRERRARQSEAARQVVVRLDGLRRQRRSDEQALEALREKAQRAELDETETRLRLEAVVEHCRRELDCEPGQAEAIGCPELPDGAASAPGRVRDLERELRLMGAINPLALEECTALNERHDLISTQLEDVKATRRELAKVIRAISDEIVAVFAAAYADVATNFEHLFGLLFPGGRGRLALTTPDDLLETGIELEAKPSGKNVKKLSLLSGGERSLTALAFLFAVFRARPSPFYVMDEVEAALDDVNLHRFLSLVDEFRQDAQLLIVSHQKRTMEAADILYGVTMAPGGSSQVVSERLSV
ncbi:MAG: chromosome segregation protein SMC [Acidimicrobiales bacterium]